MFDWVNKISDIASSIGDFFVTMWNDDDRWWCIGGLVVVLIILYKIIIRPLISLFSGGVSTSSYSRSTSVRHESSAVRENKRIVTIKGVYQMNGPKPFTREMKVSPSQIGYYTQLMGNRQLQAKWIRAHFPGADTARGFSMSVNIK